MNKRIQILIQYVLLILQICFCHAIEKPNDLSKQTQTFVKNAGFESDFDTTWEVYGLNNAKCSFEVSISVSRSGEKSVKLTKSNSFGYLVLSSKNTVKVVPGASYTFRFWFNSANAHISSLLIPRVVVDKESNFILNKHRGLTEYDHNSQTLMRNAPSTNGDDWVKRVIYYKNETDKNQEVYLQMLMYGNPFDVYIDDVEFHYGKIAGTLTPSNPPFAHTRDQVLDIIKVRDAETASFTFSNNGMEFNLNGRKEWPFIYRSVSGRSVPNAFGFARDDSNKDYGFPDPQGFAENGVTINNVFCISNYWVGKDSYDWEGAEKGLLQVLRKNPNAKLFLDLYIDPYPNWVHENLESNWEMIDGKKLNEASYSSIKWREDGAKAIKYLIRDMKKHGYWKIVVGCHILGGHDAQFWTKTIGDFAADYSSDSLKAWQKYLNEVYGNIKSLNKIWGTDYLRFKDIKIPVIPTNHEMLNPILARGALPDYRQFAEDIAYDLREHFAQIVKDEAGKKIFISSYDMPHENQKGKFFKMAGKKGNAVDLLASISYYPYRQPGFASGFQPEQTFGYHNSGLIQELDLRYFTSDMAWYDELALNWCGSQQNIKDWRNMHRKYVGISLANNFGVWYYDMDKQFGNNDVQNEIGEVKKIADKLALHKGVSFKPDACLVRFDAESRYYPTSTDNVVGRSNHWQNMLLETSGVPYNVHYLDDIMNDTIFQDYKIYIFHNNSYLSESQKKWINKNLKKDGKTIIWMYDTGYVSDNGLSTEGMSQLIGMQIATIEGYSRAVTRVAGDDKLVGSAEAYTKVPEFQGMSEAFCSVFTANGTASNNIPYICKFGYFALPGVSRYQKFWINGGYDAALGKYLKDDKVSIGVKRFKKWTSVYIGAPNALSGEMLNNIAKEAGAYRTGDAAMAEIRMNGKFISYHTLRSGTYKFHLPRGASKVIDPETGSIIAEGVSSFTIDGKAQNTYWFFIK